MQLVKRLLLFTSNIDFTTIIHFVFYLRIVIKDFVLCKWLDEFRDIAKELYSLGISSKQGKTSGHVATGAGNSRPAAAPTFLLASKSVVPQPSSPLVTLLDVFKHTRMHLKCMFFLLKRRPFKLFEILSFQFTASLQYVISLDYISDAFSLVGIVCSIQSVL